MGGGHYHVKHFGIAAGIAAILVSFSLGYVLAATALYSSKSSVYEAIDGPKAVFSYQITITLDSVSGSLTAKDRKAILSQVCTEAAKDFAIAGW